MLRNPLPFVCLLLTRHMGAGVNDLRVVPVLLTLFLINTLLW